MRLVRYSYPAFRTVNPALSFQRSPWSGLENQIDRLFESTFSEVANAGTGRFPVDLYEDAANTYVRAELPGVSREAINVEVVDGDLTIAATRKTPASENQPEETASFTRSISLNDEVQ